MDRQMWFVRHAQSEYNKKIIYWWHDLELTNMEYT